VETWRGLLMREASRDNSAVDISWLGRSRATLPRGEMLRDQVHRFAPPAAIPAEPRPAEVSILPETDRVCSDEAPSAPESAAPVMDAGLNNAAALTLDIAAIEQRYPLLRNAL
jgi:hypothetical protein